jgi:hypothetical protein
MAWNPGISGVPEMNFGSSGRKAEFQTECFRKPSDQSSGGLSTLLLQACVPIRHHRQQRRRRARAIHMLSVSAVVMNL